MKALVITTEYPFPPRNGVTIPVANYILLLKELGWVVDLVVIGGEPPNPRGDQVNKALFLGKQRSVPFAVAKEVLLISPFSCNFSVTPRDWKENHLVKKFDIVLVSPINMVAIGKEVVGYLSAKFRHRPRFIAAISDCYTAELYKAVSGKKLFGISLPSLNRLRSLYMGKVERALLGAADKVFVQSAKDKDWLKRISCGLIDGQVSILTNGVDEGLFELTIRTGQPARRFCFVADFRSNDYRHKLLWLYRNVWANLDISGKELSVVGRGLRRADSAFKEIFMDTTVIIKDQFHDKVSDIYAGMDVLFAPIFKNHGFINKVGEALAGGVVVIGDDSAFNAIEGFVVNTHGLSANTGVEMVALAKRVHNDVALFDALKQNGRRLAEKSLRWKSKRAIFNEI